MIEYSIIFVWLERACEVIILCCLFIDESIFNVSSRWTNIANITANLWAKWMHICSRASRSMHKCVRRCVLRNLSICVWIKLQWKCFFFLSFKFSVRIWIAVFQFLNRQPEIIAWSKFYFVPNLFDVLKQNVLRLIARTNRQQIIGILIYCVDCWRKNNIATIKETILSYWWMTKYSYGQQYIHLSAL